MFIEDEEMRQIFKVVCEEHFQKLDEGLLDLEKHISDSGKLNDLLREAHTLKSDANMLGLKDIGTLAHTIEDILGDIKRDNTIFSPAISDRLYQGLDVIRKLAAEAITGEPSPVNVFQSLARLRGASTTAVETPTQEQKAKVVNGVKQLAAVAVAEPIPVSTSSTEKKILPVAGNEKNQPVAIGNYRIETIRLETNKLDALMTQAGELIVSKIRIAHRLTEIEELITLWEEWSQDAFVNRFAFKEIHSGKQNGKLNQASLLPTLQNFYHRTTERLERLGTLANRLRNNTYEDNARLEVVTTELEEGIRTLRLLPLSNIFNLFPRMVRDLAKQQGKAVNLIIEGGETHADKRILEEMKDPLMHMIRNAIDHGIETPEERERLGKPPTATLRLKGYNTTTSILIELSDDGRGLDIETIKQTALKRGICREEELAYMTITQIQSLIFAPGFSTRTFVTEVSGRGVGLDVVRTNVERLKGTIQVESKPGMGTKFRLQLSSTLATAHVLIVEVDGISYAIPLEYVETTLLVRQDDIFLIEDRENVILEGQAVSLFCLADFLEISSNKLDLSIRLKNLKDLPCIIIKIGDERLGFIVNALLYEQDVVIKPQSKLLQRIRNVSGATILGTGEVCMVLNPPDLLKSVRKTITHYHL